MNSTTIRTAHLLLADDQPQILTALGILLKGQGFQIETATSAAGILEVLQACDFDAVLMDLNYTRGSTTGEEGLGLLARIQEIDATLPVIVMTAWSSVKLAVEAMRRWARDFLAKPWKNERLLIQRALARDHDNMSEVAKALGLSRSALYRRLEKHGLKSGEIQ